MLTDKQEIAKYIDIYMGGYSPIEQYASAILLKMHFKEDYKKLMDIIREELGFKINNRNSSAVALWKKKVKAIGKCEICGKTKKLVAHHIIPWEYSITGRTDINNGQCLCEKCHKMMHNDKKWINYMRCRYGKYES